MPVTILANGTYGLALGTWLGAMLMGGLVTAHYRLMGLHRNGLLEESAIGSVLADYLRESRRFQVTVGLLYLGLTVLGAFTWGRILQVRLGWEFGLKFNLLFLLVVLVAWYVGGLLFKFFASSGPLAYVRLVGGVIFPLNWLLRPVSTALLAVMDRVDDTLWTADMQSQLSEGEIRSLISEESDNTALDEDEREMIQSIFNFHETAVREIMLPRIDMVCLDGALGVDEVVRRVIESGHSRIPVYEGSVDKVAGILYSKDLLQLVDGIHFTAGDRKIADLMRPAYFIPESKKIDEVLDEFRAQRIHMAVVIDEYGGTAGLVTIEDILEEIVGEIEDEFDTEEELLTWVDDRSVRLDPKIDLEDLQEQLGVDLTEAEGADTSETLGGLIYEAAGNVPARGDCIEVAAFTVTVEEVADQRILQVLLQSAEPLPGFAKRLGD